jgi:hypothetical protein
MLQIDIIPPRCGALLSARGFALPRCATALLRGIIVASISENFVSLCEIKLLTC